MGKISIIIPAHNEEKRIGRTLEEYGEFFSELKEQGGLSPEIIVVLNACEDNTIGVVKDAEKKFDFIKSLNLEQGSKGFAVIQGFKDALSRKNELIGFVDADLATKPGAFYDLIKQIESYDGVIASRALKESKVRMKLARRATNRGFNFLVRSVLFLPYKDTQCGAKIFKRKAIEETIKEIRASRWAFDVDLLYRMRKKGFKIKEVPTVWSDRAGSKVGLIAPLQMFSSIMRLRLVYSPFRFIVKLYDILPEWIKIHNLP